MKNLHQPFLIVLLITLSCNSRQEGNSSHSERSTDPSVPELYACVNDHADILTDEEEFQLNNLLRSLEDSVGSQMAILSVNSLDGKTIEEFSINVAENWRIGRADYDDGILITLAPVNRTVRIEVGYGLELIIKDEIAKRIIDSIMVPEFVKGDYYSGLANGSKEIIHLIYSKPAF